MSLAARLETIDWNGVATDLDSRGWAMLNAILQPRECDAVAALYPQDAGFRSRVVMARHGFGRGEYKYFSYPLPGLVAELRSALYSRPGFGSIPWISPGAEILHFSIQLGARSTPCRDLVVRSPPSFQ